MAIRIGKVYAQFGWRQREYHPPASRVDEGKLKRIPEKGSDRLGLLGKDERVDSGNHGFTSLKRAFLTFGQCLSVLPPCYNSIRLIAIAIHLKAERVSLCVSSE